MSKTLCYVAVAFAIFGLVTPAMAADPGKGNVLFEYFFDIGGTAVANMTSNAKYPDHPDDSAWLPSFLHPAGATGGVSWRENYGARGRAYVYPPQTGDYTFWVAGDDECQLWLSTDENPANAVMIAQVTGWTQAQDWTASVGSTDTAKMKSKPIHLEAGKRYYIEGLLKEAGGGDSIGVAWGGPGIGAGPVLLDGKYLAAWIRNPEPMLMARNPVPANGATGVTMPLLTWTPEAGAFFEDIYLGTTPDLTSANLVSHQMAVIKMWYHTLWPLVPGNTYYWRVDDIEMDGTLRAGQVWSFTMAPLNAFVPAPADGERWVDPNTDPAWQPGAGAQKHDVYFGTDQALVAGRDASVLKGQKQLLPTLALPVLNRGTTYYWLVDEYDMTGAKHEGSVWSFTTAPVVTKTPNLIGWWKMEDEKGKRVIDYSGWDHQGTITGNPQWVDGFQGNGLQFDGSDDYVTVGAVGISGAAPRTIAGWAKANSTNIAQWTTLFGFSPNSSSNDTYFDIQRRDYSSYAIHVYGWERDLIPVDLEWHHLAAAYDGTAIRWFADGAEVGSEGHANLATSDTVQFGKRGDRGSFFPGVLDDIRIYDKALTVDEIKQAMRGDTAMAWDPHPAQSSEVDIRNATELSWSAGDTAVSHDVYFAREKDTVVGADKTSAAFLGEQAGTTFNLTGKVEFGGGDYFWRIDEVDAGGTTHRGTVWKFTVPAYLVVDNFESYKNDSPNRVFQTWIDGLGFTADEFFPSDNPGNGSSASVGHDIWKPGTPYTSIMETSIVHGGGQSMPFDYNNINNPYYSETDRTWTAGQNWTTSDVNTLSLWFHGSPIKFLETATGISMSGAGQDIYGGTDEFRFAYKKLTGDGSISVKIESVQTLEDWTKAGVMIRESLDPLAMQAHMITAARQSLVEWMYRGISNDTVTTQFNTPANSTPLPVWVRLTRSGNTFTGEYSTNGTAWNKITQTDGTASSTTLVMPSTVYIGLVVCSHVANVSTAADFSAIKTTGNVTGQWQTVDMTLAQPGNDPDQLYVVLQDSNGKNATVNHPDGTNAVLTSDWTEWRIPLTQFTGVNPKSIKKMIIGVGDRKNPKLDGHGVLYFDDIRVIKPTP